MPCTTKAFVILHVLIEMYPERHNIQSIGVEGGVKVQASPPLPTPPPTKKMEQMLSHPIVMFCVMTFCVTFCYCSNQRSIGSLHKAAFSNYGWHISINTKHCYNASDKINVQHSMYVLFSFPPKMSLELNGVMKF